MRVWTVVGLGCLLVGCQPSDPPVPPSAPVAEDLSTWVVPALVQPAPRAVVARPGKVPAGSAEKVYDYAPGVTVDVPVALDQPLDIVLEAGEQVRQIVDGDRAPAEQGQVRRWEVKEGGDGLGDGLRPHVFVTVTEAGLTNGITITTTRRAYYIACKSVPKSPVRVLRWHYPSAPGGDLPPDDAPGLLPHPGQPRRYHVGYELTFTRQPPPEWTPRHIVDDGAKLYLIYPEVTLFTSVPLVRLLGVGGPHVVNARQYLNVVILDQLPAALELRVGVGEAADVVTITRGKALRTITCPDEGPACPVWPAAAFAGRLP